jgi:transposase, IS5 family
MKQMSLATSGFELVIKRTCKREFLDEMNLVIPWSELLSLIAPHAPAGKTGRPPFATEVMLRIHLLQQFFGHSDPAMEEALHDIPLYQEFAHLDAGMTRLPDESTILRFRHMLEAHGLPSCFTSVEDASIDLIVAYWNKGSGQHGGHSLRGISYLGQAVQIS